MDRRDFIQTCALSAAVGLPVLAQETASPRYYNRARLVDASGLPIKSRSLATQRDFIFRYPYAGTPCFLLNLGKPVRAAAALKTADARSYQWLGGVGASSSYIICSYRRAAATASGI